MRRLVALAVSASAAALLVALPSTAAFAATHDVLTTGKVGGPNVKVGALLQGGLKTGTKATFLTSKSAGISCKSVSFTDKVTKNPSKPGVATEQLTAQTYKKCSVSGITGATGVKSVVLNNLPYKTTISDAKGNPVIVFGTTATLTLTTVLGPLSCQYKATKTNGSASNTGQTISFVSQAFKLKAGPSACPATGSFSATFGPVKDTSVKGSPHVFVN